MGQQYVAVVPGLMSRWREKIRHFQVIVVILACVCCFWMGTSYERHTITSRMETEIYLRVHGMKGDPHAKDLVDAYNKTIINVGRRSDYLEHSCLRYDEFTMPAR
jgi:hypothetical protein